MTLTTDSRIQGTISVHSRGFGFINFELRGKEESAFVPPPALNPFLAGDIVEATLVTEDDGRYSAEDIELVERKRAVVFGQVTYYKGKPWLNIDDDVSNTNWPLDGRADKDDYVLGQLDGDRVKLAWVLDEDDDIPLERLIARYDLVEEFDDDCLAEAKKISSKPHKLKGRRDLRDVTTITIDAPVTTDLDDAISVLPADSEGAVRLLVSIADPAEFIKEGSVLDEEARARGTSTYLSDKVIPMLPDSLSSGHLSLKPGEERCCVTVELRIDMEGETRSVDIYESLIKSKTRVTYREIDNWLETGKLSKNLAQIEEILPWLRTIQARLAVARYRRGGVKSIGEETAQVTLDENGNVSGTKPSRTTRANLMIERFMVAANEAVARWLSERGAPGIYRIHPEPDPEEVDVLTQAAQLFGFQPGFKSMLTPGALAAFDRQIRGVPCEPAVRSVLRGILKRARYTPSPGLHLGLGAPKYLHFTSPLRRYSDFAVHRIIKAYLKGERDMEPEDPQFEDLCGHLNYRAMLAAKAESFRRRMLLAEFMADQVGEEFEARVTRVLPFGLVAQLDESLVEGLLPLESLPGGPWTTSTTSVQSKERQIMLGEALRVKLVSAEPEEGELEYALLES